MYTYICSGPVDDKAAENTQWGKIASSANGAGGAGQPHAKE